ncbi:hypothetical protein N7E81_14760 [Reichenbachiella carrageenanivorans]|uniref:Uncharacterized protein n=1 Tax=Reichenbachiella carrageenanivorans TaxID=2979869 RepID=A0ABY6D433_9BACT|nr:hypothetical protein [Reichenbachiella carrageenanivorans]UXX78620.1 hypothetical protein N7E81_14760 [Reichenbachiella carrageenanivorans]
MFFSQTFLSVLIVLALAGIAATVIALVWLFVKDIKSKKLW